MRWRSVGPNPLNPDILEFGTESLVGSINDYTSRTPATTSGRAGPGAWRNVVAFNRNTNVPFTSHMVQAVSSTGPSFLARSFAVSAPHSVLLLDSYRMAGEVSIGHYDANDTFYLMFIRDY